MKNLMNIGLVTWVMSWRGESFSVFFASFICISTFEYSCLSSCLKEKAIAQIWFAKEGDSDQHRKHIMSPLQSPTG
jgi:hypothetical protein